MVRLNPKYEEFFYEDIINYFLFCKTYLKNDRLNNKNLKRQIFRYITSKKGLNSCFFISKEFLKSIKCDFVVPLFYDFFSVFDLSIPHKDEILFGAMKLIIYNSFNFGFEDLEISSSKYFLKRYPEIIEMLLIIRSDHFQPFEIYIKDTLGNLWDSFYVQWSKFRKNTITYGEFLDEVYKIVDEKEFIQKIHKFSLEVLN